MNKKIYDINIYINSAYHTKKIKKLRELSPQMFADYRAFLINSQHFLNEDYNGIFLGDWKDNHCIYVGNKYILKYNTYIAYNPNTLSQYSGNKDSLLDYVTVNEIIYDSFNLALRYLRHEHIKEVKENEKINCK